MIKHLQNVFVSSEQSAGEDRYSINIIYFENSCRAKQNADGIWLFGEIQVVVMNTCLLYLLWQNVLQFRAFLAKWASLISLQPPSSRGWQLPSKQAAASGYTVWPLDFLSVTASQILHRIKRNDGGLSSLFNIVPESSVSLWSSVAGGWFSIMQETKAGTVF